MTLRPVKTERDKWADEAVEQLRNALKHAEENPQESVAIVMLGRNQDLELFYSTMDKAKLIGHMEVAKINIGKFQ